MAAPTIEVEDTIRELKKISGFDSYLIINHDGIVIKWENMTLKTAVHYSYQISSLTNKASKHVQSLLEPPDNEIESIRLRTSDYEMVIAQLQNFTIVVTQKTSSDKESASEEKKEGEGEAAA